MNIVIVGATGSLGSALVRLLVKDDRNIIFALARKNIDSNHPRIKVCKVDFKNERSLGDISQLISAFGEVDLVINTVGLLHSSEVSPEKSLRSLNVDNLSEYFFVNAICTGLLLKHFLPILRKKSKAIFASLSARVGSIEDNRLGGWYGYRASKAAHNMLIKTASIELMRTHKEALVVGLHPGTVDSPLSRPYTRNKKNLRVFTPVESASALLSTLQELDVADSGKIFAYDGSIISY